MKRKLSDLDVEANKTASAISRLSGGMRDKTLEGLETINEKGLAALLSSPQGMEFACVTVSPARPFSSCSRRSGRSVTGFN